MIYISKGQIKRLLEVALLRNPNPELAQRDHLGLLLTYTHGLRTSELVNLQVEDVADGRIVIRRLKGSLKSNQPLHKNGDRLFDEAGAVALVISGRSPGESLLGIRRRQWHNRMSVLAGLAGVHTSLRHMHSLKHAVCRNLVKDGVGVEMVRLHVGHAELSSTGHYLLPDDNEVADAVTPNLW